MLKGPGENTDCYIVYNSREKIFKDLYILELHSLRKLKLYGFIVGYICMTKPQKFHNFKSSIS